MDEIAVKLLEDVIEEVKENQVQPLSSALQKRLIAFGSRPTPDAPDGATCAHENWTEVDRQYYCYDCKSVITAPPVI